MDRTPQVTQLAFEDFVLRFGGKLRSDNRWVLLAKPIPWAVVETACAQQFSKEEMGSPAKSSRLALGALILKERLGVTDRELVEQIAETPYLQYFLGLMAYQDEAPFHHSLLTTFRKRFTHESAGTINEAIARLIVEKTSPTTHEPTHDDQGDEQGEHEAPSLKGQLLIDATCVLTDITYPTDLNILNKAREQTEVIINHLHTCRTTSKAKPRTSWQNARQAYLRVAKARKPKMAILRHGMGNSASVALAQSGIDCRHGLRRAA